MPTTVTVFETKLRSTRALRDAMKYHRYSIRALADEVSRDLRRQRERGVSHQSLGHLLTGYQKTVRPEVARAIEEILKVAPGALFDSRVSNLSREVRGQSGSVAPGVALLMLSMASLLVVAGVWFGLGWMQAELTRMGEMAGQWIGGVL